MQISMNDVIAEQEVIDLYKAGLRQPLEGLPDGLPIHGQGPG